MTSPKRVFKDSLYAVLVALQLGRSSNGSILMYHSVGDDGAFFTISLSEFEKQIQYLVRKEFKVLKLSEFLQRYKSTESLTKTISITFDDGYVNNYEIVFPILKKYKVPVTIFLSTGLVGKTQTNSEEMQLPILTEAQIKEMHESGLVEFLPHGENHKKLHVLQKEEARDEIAHSLTSLERMIGPTPRIFAYPSGKYSPETIEILKEEGFVAAVTVKPGLVHESANLYELPRNHVDSQTSFIEFVARLSVAGEWHEKLKGSRV